jgi:hypothetical protein
MNHVDIVRNAVSTSLCDALIGLHTHAVKHVGAHRLDTPWQRCTKVAFPQDGLLGSDALLDAFQREVKPHLDAYKKRYPTLNFCSLLEQPNVISYDPANPEPEHFHEHCDAWNAVTATRAVSLILTLNDVAEGGETVFPSLEISSRPETGKLLLFPSYFTHSHLALQPKSSVKYIVVTWMHFGGDPGRYLTVPLLA